MMKIIFKDYQIELSIEELKELSDNLHPKESTMTHQDSSNKPSVESDKEVDNKVRITSTIVKEITPSSENSTKKGIGSGNYYHKPKIPQDKIDMIKKIYENYPERSIRTVAKEVGLDQSTILRWKKKLFPPKEESWHD